MLIATIYTSNYASLSSGYWKDHNRTDKCEEDEQKYRIWPFAYIGLIIDYNYVLSIWTGKYRESTHIL